MTDIVPGLHEIRAQVAAFRTALVGLAPVATRARPGEFQSVYADTRAFFTSVIHEMEVTMPQVLAHGVRGPGRTAAEHERSLRHVTGLVNTIRDGAREALAETARREAQAAVAGIARAFRERTP